MLKFIENLPGGTKAVYRCGCGNLTVAFRGNVAKGHTSSCGCLRSEVTSLRSTVHGHSRKKSRVYVAWKNMRQRCTNPSVRGFKNYGGRGITVCARWEKFENFLADMGEPPENTSLDRIDNEKGYVPSNCRWAPRKVQAQNKRSVAMYTHGGKTMCLGDWADATGIGRVTLLKRLQRGVPFAVAISTKGYLRL